MPGIRVLPEVVASQIAAGEVVERPASVVKELVENALDAGASRIAVEVEAGGAQRIRVSDDGTGMGADDARLAFERHATSKIREAADLRAIRTYGFRGEALPAIASVARVTLSTAGEGVEGGIRVSIHGGHPAGSGPTAHPRGTTIEVEGLFYNAPARRKFMRSPAAETARIADTLTRLAAAHPAVGFSLTSGGRELLAWPPVDGWEARIRQIVGADEAAALIPIEAGRGRLRLRALASGPSLSRATGREQHLFVNGRPIRDRRVLHAIQDAYATLLPRGRYPVVYLFLELPPDEVDVNVHPAKSEVRFRSPDLVHDLVRHAIREGLGVVRPFHPLGGPAPTLSEPAAGGRWASPPAPEAGLASPGTGVPPPPAGPAPPLLETGPLLRPLAQFRDTYILAAADDGLVIVDQHAAHERILYERLLRGEERAGGRQSLLFPLTLELSAQERQGFDEARQTLVELGFEVEPFGERAIVVRAVPAAVPAAEVEPLLRDLLAQALEWRRPEGMDGLRHRIAASAACHAAVTANQPLDLARMGRLLGDLMTTATPMTCPHGRPAVIRLAVDHLEREFRRR